MSTIRAAGDFLTRATALDPANRIDIEAACEFPFITKTLRAPDGAGGGAGGHGGGGKHGGGGHGRGGHGRDGGRGHGRR
jgi:hypothetical protein